MLLEGRRKEQRSGLLMIIGNKEFKLNEKPYVMGILNVTPDSFSDGGTHNKFDDALYATEQIGRAHV